MPWATKTTVGRLALGTLFRTCLTRREGSVIEQSEKETLVTIAALEDPTYFIDKGLHPNVIVEVQ